VLLKWVTGKAQEAIVISTADTCQNVPVKKRNRVIVVQLMGGLGNQMFQYAHALRIARSLDADLELQQPSGRRFFLDLFGLKCTTRRQLPDSDSIHFEGTYTDGMEDSILKAASESSATRILLRGYFQNERFFSSVSEEVRRVFEVTPQLPIEIQADAPICVQVRRGDFIGNPKHDVCTLDYFQDAMNMVRGLFKEVRFFMVSDDLPWCRQQWGTLRDVFIPASQSEFEGLQTMAGCRAFIISNSTFGWWGAYLSGSAVVIAPEPFVAGVDWNILPSHWIRMPGRGVTSRNVAVSQLRRDPISLES
jgi:hypothetical protein